MFPGATYIHVWVLAGCFMFECLVYKCVNQLLRYEHWEFLYPQKLLGISVSMRGLGGSGVWGAHAAYSG